MKSLYMKKKKKPKTTKKKTKKKHASDVWRLFAVTHIGQSSFYRAYVTAPATGILRR